MKKELFTNLLLILFVAFLGVSFTACSDDDYPESQVYTYGWETFDATGTDADMNFLAEMGTVEKAFNQALGSASPLIIEGSAKDCNATVIANCHKAEETLKDKVWGVAAISSL